jgi:hypothetical protein
MGEELWRGEGKGFYKRGPGIVESDVETGREWG